MEISIPSRTTSTPCLEFKPTQSKLDKAEQKEASSLAYSIPATVYKGDALSMRDEYSYEESRQRRSTFHLTCTSPTPDTSSSMFRIAPIATDPWAKDDNADCILHVPVDSPDDQQTIDYWIQIYVRDCGPYF